LPSKYIARDVDSRLTEAIKHARYVLVVGRRGSGKTRSALEALTRAEPQPALIVPVDGDGLTEVVAHGLATPARAGSVPEAAVLWLDDVDRFVDALQLGRLDQLVLNRRWRVVATVADERFSLLIKSGSPAGHRLRELAARAAVVQVPLRLTDSEVERARDVLGEDVDLGGGLGAAIAPSWARAEAPQRLGGDAEATGRKRSKWAALRGAARHPIRAVGRAARGAVRGVWRDPWLSISLVLCGVAVAWLVVIEYEEGLRQPAKLEAQIEHLRQGLAQCGLQQFSGDADSLAGADGAPLVAAVATGRQCREHAAGEPAVLVYRVHHDRLHLDFSFQPPPGSFAGSFSRFACRGAAAQPCWTKVTGEGHFAILGVFRNPAVSSVLPVAAYERNGHWTVQPLVTARPRLSDRYNDATFSTEREYYQRTGLVVTDVAVLPVSSSEEPLPARVVAGFAPKQDPRTPAMLETEARLLHWDDGPAPGTDQCLVVIKGVRRQHLFTKMSGNGRRPPAEVLERRWQKLESVHQGICVVKR
jgi:hypothetical protein